VEHAVMVKEYALNAMTLRYCGICEAYGMFATVAVVWCAVHRKNEVHFFT
jgi:hypothetical protein